MKYPEGFSFDEEKGIIKTPYYTIQLPDEWIGKSELYVISPYISYLTDRREGDDALGAGGQVRIVRTDEGEFHGIDDIDVHDGNFDVIMYLNLVNAEDGVEQVEVGESTQVKGWKAYVLGPASAKQEMEELAKSITLN